MLSFVSSVFSSTVSTVLAANVDTIPTHELTAAMIIGLSIVGFFAILFAVAMYFLLKSSKEDE